MKTFSLLAILMLSCAGSVRSADETPATDAQAAAPASNVSLVDEKNKSSFTIRSNGTKSVLAHWVEAGGKSRC